MIFLLVSCFSFSFILISKSSFPPWKRENMRLLLPNLSSFLVSCLQKSSSSSFAISLWLQVPLMMIMPLKKLTLSSKVENVAVEDEEYEERSLLDLPELTLECILQRLSPAGLCSMSEVCTSMRDRCRSDHLWEKHMKQKWGRLMIGDAAHQEWQLYMVASRKKREGLLIRNKKQKGLFDQSLLNIWPFSSWSWIRPKLKTSIESISSSLPVDSVMAWYLSLESGKFWFPAQVYNRENGNVGFMLSCYDAKVRYDSVTDTFHARYSPHGRQTTEDNIHWDRLRAPPINTPPHVLHVSDCLNDLKPGDHMEVQWRKTKEFPYGWWYGVIGHLESCDGNENHCHCHSSDSVILEFNQYMPGSQWRRTVISRKDHREEGNESDGFYGGTRKLYNKDEISTWKRLQPNQVIPL